MELLQLKYFQCVAKHENISKAAEELHISQPSLSITIKRLEDELNVPLFTRKGRSIEINTFGEHFLKHVNSIINQIENSKLELLEVYGKKNKHLTISASTSFFLEGVLKDFLLIKEEITMSQTINTNGEIIDKLKERSIDFAITSPPIVDPSIETIDLIEEEIVVVIPKTHILAYKGMVYLNELKNEEFISLASENFFKKITDKMFLNAGFKPNIRFEGDGAVISELMEIKKAVALIPISICLKSEKENYTILRLKDNLNKRKISISYRKNAFLSELAKEFLDFVVEFYKERWYTIENYKNLKENQ
ncbi:MAG: LysR family transcriptional regulator [Clostridium sp.]|uniref:LysR family transcriptional regulator n=1 Tax=Clostridium sp. TaxID=1506 RepID=UPI003F2B0FA2